MGSSLIGCGYGHQDAIIEYMPLKDYRETVRPVCDPKICLNKKYIYI